MGRGNSSRMRGKRGEKGGEIEHTLPRRFMSVGVCNLVAQEKRYSHLLVRAFRRMTECARGTEQRATGTTQLSARFVAEYTKVVQALKLRLRSQLPPTKNVGLRGPRMHESLLKFVSGRRTAILSPEKPMIQLGYTFGSSSRSALSLALRKSFLVEFGRRVIPDILEYI